MKSTVVDCKALQDSTWKAQVWKMVGFDFHEIFMGFQGTVQKYMSESLDSEIEFQSVRRSGSDSSTAAALAANARTAEIKVWQVPLHYLYCSLLP